MELRDYQVSALAHLSDELEFHDRVLMVSPTGSGKTVIFCHWLAQNPNLKVLVLAHREELIHQTAKTLIKMGLSFGTITAEGNKNLSERIHLAMVQTFARRKSKIPTRYDVIIADEAHLSAANSYKGIFETQPQAKIVGFTATPVRLGKQHKLSDIYESLFEVTTTRHLIEQGHLANYSGFVYEQPDMRGVKVKNGEFDSEETGRRGSAIVGDVVGRWLESASTLSTAVFAASLNHSKALVEAFQARGVSAESVDGGTPAGLRRDIFRRMADGSTRVLVNVGIVTEGFDLPSLKCVVLCRPTMSLALYLQMVGRALRLWRGAWARIHDHAGCVLKHGLPDQIREWTLDSTTGDRGEVLPGLSTCRKCLAIFLAGQSCPHGCVKEIGTRNGPEVILSGNEIDISQLRNGTASVKLTWSEVGKGGAVSGTFRGHDNNYVYVEDKKLDLNHSLRGQLKKHKIKAGQQVTIKYADDRDVGKPKKMRVFQIAVGE